MKYLYLIYIHICSIFSAVLVPIYISATSTCTIPCAGTIINPYPDISSALLLSGGKNFILLDGVYSGSQNTNIYINQPFNLSSQNGPFTTIIDCGGISSGLSIQGGNHYIEGITYMNCKKAAPGDPSDLNSGAAIFSTKANLYLTNMRFFNCLATYGGGVACINGTCLFTSVEMFNNQAEKSGGAIFIAYSNSNITSNSSIYQNKAALSGGGVSCQNGKIFMYGENISVIQNDLTSLSMASQFSCSICGINLNFTGSVDSGAECDGCKVTKECPTPGLSCVPECLCRDNYFSLTTQKCTSCPSDIATCKQQSCTDSCAGFYCQGVYCFACHISCKTCTGPYSDNCTVCVDSNSELDQPTQGRCICKQGYVLQPNYSCAQCSPNCYDCSGILPHECLTCKSGYFWKSGECVAHCNWNEYVSSSNSCEPCHTSCLGCNGGTSSNCLSCPFSYHLSQGKCLPIECLPNEYLSMLNQCERCDPTCLGCSGATDKDCVSCATGFSLDNGVCNKNPIDPTIKKQMFAEIKIENISLYHMKFSEYLNDFHENLINLTIIETNDRKVNLNYSIKKEDLSNNLLYELRFYNNWCLKENSEILLNVTFDFGDRSDYVLMNRTFFFVLLLTPGQKSACDLLLGEIDFNLYYTEKMNVILLKFNKEYDILPSINMSLSEIQIENLKNEEDYNFIVIKSTNKSYFICIFYKEPQTKRNLLNVTPPFIKKTHSILLFLFYSLDGETVSKIDENNQQKVLYPTSRAIIAAGVLSRTSSSGSFAKNMMLVELMFILKYIDLAYPPILINFFHESSNNSIKVFWRYEFEIEDETHNQVFPPLYSFYGINQYFLHYAGEHLVQLTVFYFTGIFLILTEKSMSFFNLNFLKKVFRILRDAFVWEIPIIVFFNHFQHNFYYSMIPMKFYITETLNEKLNFVCSIFSLTVLFLFFVHSYRILSKIYKMDPENKKKNNIFPLKEDSFRKNDKTLENSPCSNENNQNRNQSPPTFSKFSKIQTRDSLTKEMKLMGKDSLKKFFSEIEIPQKKDNIEVKDLETPLFLLRERIQKEKELKKQDPEASSQNEKVEELNAINNSNTVKNLSKIPSLKRPKFFKRRSSLQAKKGLDGIDRNEKNDEKESSEDEKKIREKPTLNIEIATNSIKSPLKIEDIDTPLYLLKRNIDMMKKDLNEKENLEKIFEDVPLKSNEKIIEEEEKECQEKPSKPLIFSENEIQDKSMEKLSKPMISSENEIKEKSLVHMISLENEMKQKHMISSENSEKILQKNPETKGIQPIEENSSMGNICEKTISNHEHEQGQESQKTLLNLGKIPPSSPSKFSWFKLRKKISKNENSRKDYEENGLKERYEILYEEYKSETWLQRNFIFMDFLRQILILIMILSFFSHGMLQVSLVICIQYAFLIITCFIKPFREWFSLINFTISETFATLAFMSCFIIGIYDSIENDNMQERSRLGGIIIISNLGLFYWLLIAVIYKIVMKIVKSRKKKNMNKIYNY